MDINPDNSRYINTGKILYLILKIRNRNLKADFLNCFKSYSLDSFSSALPKKVEIGTARNYKLAGKLKYLLHLSISSFVYINPVWEKCLFFKRIRVQIIITHTLSFV